jgi:hypothetical protein
VVEAVVYGCECWTQTSASGPQPASTTLPSRVYSWPVLTSTMAFGPDLVPTIAAEPEPATPSIGTYDLVKVQYMARPQTRVQPSLSRRRGPRVMLARALPRRPGVHTATTEISGKSAGQLLSLASKYVLIDVDAQKKEDRRV